MNSLLSRTIPRSDFSLPRVFGLILLILSLSLAAIGSLRADLMDDAYSLQTAREETLLDFYGGRVPQADLQAEAAKFAGDLQDAEARQLFQIKASPSPATVGADLGRIQHVFALEMLHAQRAGEIETAREWRALIQLPQHASAVEGALALQTMAARPEVTTMLAREYLSWQTTRVREKLDQFSRTLAAGRLDAQLAAARNAEIVALVHFPPTLLQAAAVPAQAIPPALLGAVDAPDFGSRFAAWRESVESALPNLLSAEDVARRERLLLKLLLLVPKEYRAGVRDGEITVPLEYSHTRIFLVQAQQLINELVPAWRKSRREAIDRSLAELRQRLDQTEEAVKNRAAQGEIDDLASATRDIATGKMGLSLAHRGPNALEEIALDVRTSLSASLAAARLGRWSEAESQRLDAYVTFDTTIEKRVLPRAPELAISTERSFLDGGHGQRGIKAALDARLSDAELEHTFQTTLTHLDECLALLKVSISPWNVALTTGSIVMREGLEAVVILAALLAGMRGVENGSQRRFIVSGVLLALAATGLTFWLSRTLIQSLTQYGEKLEAVISILAVCILLMVTNWVFHKVYWVQWNAKLRQLRNQVTGSDGRPRWEWLGLLGVGFLTIYREGFETSLFLQSLVLEGGTKPVGLGVLGGLVFVCVVGFGIFGIGKKLPYRKLLIVTGLLVVAVLVTFLGSTVRLFQTVGWISIHPITSLEIPTWMGTWLGIYPSWEGILIPPLGFLYVAAAWLWTKWQARQKQHQPGSKKPTPSGVGQRLPARKIAQTSG